MSAVTYSAVDLVLAAAQSAVGASECPPGTNTGPFVAECLRAVHLDPDGKYPWCAAFVARTGFVALGPRWPVPLTGSCQAIMDWSQQRKVLYATPEVGDLFLVWHEALGRFAHVGFVVADRLTISGNTTAPADRDAGKPANAREGWIVAQKPWPFRPADRFARWCEAMA